MTCQFKQTIDWGNQFARDEGKKIALGIVQDGKPGMSFGDLACANPHRFFQMGVVRLHLQLQPSKTEMGFHAGEHLFSTIRFGNIIHSAAIERRDLVLSFTQCGNEQDRDIFQHGIRV